MTENSYHKDIYTLPLVKFEDCLLTGNLSALVISGFPGEDELMVAWEDIMTEYTEAMGDSDYKMYINLYKEVEMLRIDHASVQLGVNILRKRYSAYIAGEVSKILRMKIVFDEDNVKPYLDQLDKCERRGKGIKMQLDIKTLEFDNIKNKYSEQTGNRKPLDRDYFTAVLIILSKHNGYEVNNSITVHKYCLHIKQRNIDIENLNNQIESVKKKR